MMAQPRNGATNNKKDNIMNDCQRIETAIGRELTVEEMCDCGIALLDGITEAQIIDNLKAGRAVAA